MTREVARREIDSLDYYLQNHTDDYSEESHTAMMMAISALSENKGEWISVSERLPERFRFVNCTCHSLIDDREDWVVETVYVPQPSNSPYSDWGNIPMLNNKECEVIAWMYREIPEPYKKGGE